MGDEEKVALICFLFLYSAWLIGFDTIFILFVKNSFVLK